MSQQITNAQNDHVYMQWWQQNGKILNPEIEYAAWWAGRTFEFSQYRETLQTARVALDRAYMTHEQDAHNVNFSRCGCDWCKAYRALNGIAE